MANRQLAFIGLGSMGGGMARRLLETGHTLTVFNRTARKAAPSSRRAPTSPTPRSARRPATTSSCSA